MKPKRFWVRVTNQQVTAMIAHFKTTFRLTSFLENRQIVQDLKKGEGQAPKDEPISTPLPQSLALNLNTLMTVLVSLHNGWF
jgi:hypothetical protein